MAKIEVINQVPTAVYTRQINHSVDDVWAYLTENNKLQQWFSELEIKSLKNDGIIHFDFGDGNFEKIDITEVEDKRVLAFTWPPKNSVCFELEVTNNGCQLIFMEYLYDITDHTVKDLTGWHVCLDVIEALLDGETIEDRKSDWKSWLPKYEDLLKEASI